MSGYRGYHSLKRAALRAARLEAERRGLCLGRFRVIHRCDPERIPDEWIAEDPDRGMSIVHYDFCNIHWSVYVNGQVGTYGTLHGSPFSCNTKSASAIESATSRRPGTASRGTAPTNKSTRPKSAK